MKFKDVKTRHNKGDEIGRLSDCIGMYEYSENTEKLLVQTIIDILLDAGISPKHKGFNYIVDSIRIMYRKRFGHVLITKDIYSRLAAMYEVSPYIIEHNIRNAIQTAWVKQINEAADKGMFETFDNKPTNFEFIVFVSRLATDIIINPQLTLWELDPEL